MPEYVHEEIIITGSTLKSIPPKTWAEVNLSEELPLEEGNGYGLEIEVFCYAYHHAKEDAEPSTDYIYKAMSYHKLHATVLYRVVGEDIFLHKDDEKTVFVGNWVVDLPSSDYGLLDETHVQVELQIATDELLLRITNALEGVPQFENFVDIPMHAEVTVKVRKMDYPVTAETI
jgi:hypothetical protein